MAADSKPLRGEALKYFEKASQTVDLLKKQMDDLKLQENLKKTNFDECIKMADWLLKDLDHARENFDEGT